MYRFSRTVENSHIPVLLLMSKDVGPEFLLHPKRVFSSSFI